MRKVILFLSVYFIQQIAHKSASMDYVHHQTFVVVMKAGQEHLVNKVRTVNCAVHGFYNFFIYVNVMLIHTAVIIKINFSVK